MRSRDSQGEQMVPEGTFLPEEAVKPRGTADADSGQTDQSFRLKVITQSEGKRSRGPEETDQGRGGRATRDQGCGGEVRSE